MAGSSLQPKKHLLQTDAIHQYILETNVYPREHEQLKEIRKATEDDPGSIMSLPPEEGQLLAWLVKLMNAKKTIEIGVFTGYSLLATALALPKDGKITAIDLDRKHFEIGLPFIQKAGMENKIEFIEAEALPILDKMLEQGKEGVFDFAFVDADKLNYAEYHKRLMKLVKVGGVVAYDNTLWIGTVTLPESVSLPENIDCNRRFLVKFNRFLASEAQVEISQLPVGDGLTLCRRLF